MDANENNFSRNPLAAIFRSKTCYAVVFSGQNMLAVRSWRAGFKAVRHATINASDGEIRQMLLAQAGRQNVEIAGCLATSESLTMWISAPFPSVTKAKKVFPSLLDIQLPFPLEECLYLLLNIRRTPDNKTRALAVAARRETIQARLEQYQSKGIDPTRLDHEGLALWTQSLVEIPAGDEAARAIIYLDRDHATLVIGTSSEFVNAHSTRLSSANAPAETETTDRLLEWIRRILHAEPQIGKPTLWAFCGPGASDPALATRIHQELNRDWPGPCVTHNEPETFLARSIGRRALFPDPLNCNLRINELIHPSILARVKKHASRTAALILISGLLLCAFNLAWFLVSRNRFARVQRAIATLSRELAPGTLVPYGMEVHTVRIAMKQQAEFMTPFLNAFAPSLLIRLADIIKAGQAAKITFQKLALNSDRIEISGATEDWNHCEQLADSLKRMGFAVKLVRAQSDTETPIYFTLNGDVATR